MTGLDRLMDLPRFGTMGVNERMEKLCQPIAQVPAIKIVGSNGKGTTAHMIADMAQRLGKTVGLYTSPHLLRVNERLQIQGREISDADLDYYLNWACDQAVGLAGCGRFEVLTLAALKYFADQQVDLAVMEVGLGGRYDPVRAARGTYSVLTSIDLEHTAILGHTIKEIAAEKAAVCRTGDILLSAVGGLEDSVPDGVAYVDLSQPPLAPLQSNARLAAHAVKAQFNLVSLPETSGVRVPGRLHKLSHTPPIYVDVAHSPKAVETVLAHFKDHPVSLICAARTDKDVESLAAQFHHVIALQVEEDMHPAEKILSGFNAPRKDQADDVAQALRLAQAHLPEGGVILCLGGFGLVGRVMAHLRGTHYDVIRL
ncbi:bifunctional folylpolyglutamate synthase/dihydrofolate synthase [Terasakiella pusilla]|uniref:bifunctional folylpolyglutamate synthase/dihydrofolate synthase n=1 Tax=Terasakiella pusilla TaxID=64973 RepID=UPI003AA931D1